MTLDWGSFEKRIFTRGVVSDVVDHADLGNRLFDHLLDTQQPVSMYGGTTSSYKEMEDVKTGWFAVLCRLIDLPLTIVADTLLLPVTAPIQLTR